MSLRNGRLRLLLLARPVGFLSMDSVAFLISSGANWRQAERRLGLRH